MHIRTTDVQLITVTHQETTMLAPQHIIDEVGNCAEWADRLVRADLINGVVVTENDYTSNFTSAFRREINSRNILGIFAHSQVLTPVVERKTGTDGCCIFRNRDYFKVGLFEAKWPRLSTHTDCWDALQRSTNMAHFDSQLDRQSRFSKFAIWEMFYSEESYGANTLFPVYGSACVWHSDAFAASSARNQVLPWTNSELKNLLASSVNDIGQIIRSILECTHGDRYPNESMIMQLHELGIKGEVLVVDLDKGAN